MEDAGGNPVWGIKDCKGLGNVGIDKERGILFELEFTNEACR